MSPHPCVYFIPLESHHTPLAVIGQPFFSPTEQSPFSHVQVLCGFTRAKVLLLDWVHFDTPTGRIIAISLDKVYHLTIRGSRTFGSIWPSILHLLCGSQFAMSKKKSNEPNNSKIKTRQLKLHLTEQEHRLLKVAVALGDTTIAEFIKSAVLNQAKEVTKNLNL